MLEESHPKSESEVANPEQLAGHQDRSREPVWLTPALLASAILFLYLVRSILTPFIVASVLAYIFSPVVGWIERRARIPRPAAVLLFLLAFLVPLLALGWAVQSTLVAETTSLLVNAPDIVQEMLVQLFGGKSFDVAGQVVDANSVTELLFDSLMNFLGTPSQAIHAATTAAEAMLEAFLSLVLFFYFILDPKPFARVILRLIPPHRRPQWQSVGREVHTVLGHYVRGLIFLVCLMSTATWFGLSFIFHLPYALPIAVATGFLEIIPFLGPVLAASIAAVVGLSTGGVGFALWIVLFYLVLRQLEDQLVMPVVIGRAVEIHPTLAIFAVLAGSALAGALGALLAIPVAAACKVAFEHWRPE